MGSQLRKPSVSDRPLADIQEDLASGALRLDDAVAELADSGRSIDLAHLLAGRRAAMKAHVLDALDGPTEDLLARLCRAAGLTVNGYSAVLRMRRRRHGAGAASPSALLSAYLALPRLQAFDAAAEIDALSEAGRSTVRQA